MYEVVVERSAERDLKKISPGVRHKLIAAIRPLAHDPRPPSCRMLVGSLNDWRIRVGNYRIIYEIADTIRIVRIHRIRHRKDAYRKS